MTVLKKEMIALQCDNLNCRAGANNLRFTQIKEILIPISSPSWSATIVEDFEGWTSQGARHFCPHCSNNDQD